MEHRGVRWRRDGAAIDWYDADRRTWVRWYRGADAPPVPPGWAEAADAVPPPVARASWRSPYRLVPVALVVAVVVFGVVQATSGSSRPSANQSRAEAAAAAALRGRCLAADGSGRYRPAPVSCAGPTAAVRVVAVRPPSSALDGGCAAGQQAVRLAFAGVPDPHVLCTVPAR